MMNKEMINRIARYCVTSGSQNTTDGRWSITYDELSHHFGVDKNDINGNAQLLADALNQQEEINDLMMTEDCIEMTYHIEHCPLCQQGGIEGAFALSSVLGCNITDEHEEHKYDDIYNLNAETICPCCGSVMKRRYEPRTKIHERWICQNRDCRKTVVKTDDSLLGEIGDLINLLIDNPDMIHCSNTVETITLESYRIENEIRHMIDGRQLNKSEIRRKLIEATAIHYANLDTKKYEIQRLKCILKNQNRPNGFPLELFNLAAETISFDEDEQVVLKLINGQTIRKEHAYAAS